MKQTALPSTGFEHLPWVSREFYLMLHVQMSVIAGMNLSFLPLYHRLTLRLNESARRTHRSLILSVSVRIFPMVLLWLRSAANTTLVDLTQALLPFDARR